MAEGELIFGGVDVGKWQNLLLPGIWASIIALFHYCSIIPLFFACIRLEHTAHRRYGTKCWFFNFFLLLKSPSEVIFFHMKEKGPFHLKVIFFFPNSKNQFGIGLDLFQAIEITHLSGQQLKGFLWCYYLDFSISLHLATLNASSVAPELIESWQKLASLVLTIL